MPPTPAIVDRFQGCLIGLAVGEGREDIAALARNLYATTARRPS